MRTDLPVAELLRADPPTLSVFERFHIDFCFGGGRSLAEACERARAPLEQVVAALSTLEDDAAALPALPTDPGGLVAYLERTHHVYTREALERLLPLAEKVARVHGAAHPEYVDLRELVQALADDLLPHLLKEERVLFPYLRALGAAGGRPVPRPPFGSAKNPIAMMHLEHERVGELLAATSTCTRGYVVPTGACGSTTALVIGLRELERDVHRHVYIENEVLFPMALAAEAQPA